MIKSLKTRIIKLYLLFLLCPAVLIIVNCKGSINRNESGNDNSPSHVPSLTECLAEVRNYLVNSPDISLDGSERSSSSEQLIMKYPGIENEVRYGTTSLLL